MPGREFPKLKAASDLWNWRKRLRLGAPTLARISGVPLWSIYDWERGIGCNDEKRRRALEKALQRFASILHEEDFEDGPDTESIAG